MSVEQSEGAGLREHEPGNVVAHRGPQGVQVCVPVAVRRDGDHVVSSHGRRRRVGPVGAVGNEDSRAPRVAPRKVVGPDHEHAGQLALRSRHGREARSRHAGDLCQEPLQLVHQLQCTLHRRGWLVRVNLGHAGQSGHLVVQLGVVLHRTAAKRVEVVVDGEVELADLGKVPDELSLAHLGHLQVASKHVAGRQFLNRHVERRHGRSDAARHAAVHQEPAAPVVEDRAIHGSHRPRRGLSPAPRSRRAS